MRLPSNRVVGWDRIFRILYGPRWCGSWIGWGWGWVGIARRSSLPSLRLSWWLLQPIMIIQWCERKGWVRCWFAEEGRGIDVDTNSRYPQDVHTGTDVNIPRHALQPQPSTSQYTFQSPEKVYDSVVVTRSSYQLGPYPQTKRVGWYHPNQIWSWHCCCLTSSWNNINILECLYRGKVCTGQLLLFDIIIYTMDLYRLLWDRHEPCRAWSVMLLSNNKRGEDACRLPFIFIWNDWANLFVWRRQLGSFMLIVAEMPTSL